MLLLDEPTNHLDLEARNWLEEYLPQYPYAYVLISHDRYFLDITVEPHRRDLEQAACTFTRGNYEKYLAQKQERRDSLVAAYKNQRERIEQLEAFINRFRAQATKAKQVQSRIKELEKIERIDVPPDEKTIHFSFPQPKPSGRIVAECRGRREELRTEGRVQQRGFHHPARRSRCFRRCQRRGKIDAHQAAGRHRTAQRRNECKLGHNVEPDYFAQDQYKELDASTPHAR